MINNVQTYNLVHNAWHFVPRKHEQGYLFNRIPETPIHEPIIAIAYFSADIIRTDKSPAIGPIKGTVKFILLIINLK